MYTRILVPLDGSDCGRFAGAIAVRIAASTSAELTACHVYGAEMHERRFRDMEPGLPGEYRQEPVLHELRTSHESLIVEGFRSMSEGYLEAFVADARAASVAAEAVVAEGRNYTGILALARRKRADLIALGAEGLGAVGDGMLGSNAVRVLRHAECDVLIARRPPAGGPVVLAVDGSDYAESAVGKAVGWATALGAPVQFAAAYDPTFHSVVFKAMLEKLPAARHEQIGLAEQEDLHDRIINDGLAKLYRGFLARAAERGRGFGVQAETALLRGKAYRAVADHAGRAGADLVIVGRHGHHRENGSPLGSNAEAVVRATGANVLVVNAPVPAERGGAAAGTYEAARPAERPAPGTSRVDWDHDALARLGRIPQFARPMARQAIERHAAAAGRQRITLADLEEVARQMGMGPVSGNSDA